MKKPNMNLKYQMPDEIGGPVPYSWVNNEMYVVCGAGNNPCLPTTAWNKGGRQKYRDDTMVWYKLNPEYAPVNTKRVIDAATKLGVDIQDAINKFTAQVAKDIT